MKMISKAAVLGTTAIVSGLLTAGAYAQVETITITAQKREQTLQDTPISVAVVDEVSLQESQVRDAADLQVLVPSLRVAEFAASTNTQFDIRGIGTSSFNPGLEPSVGVFIDGVYRPNAGAAINDLLSVQRVEVLRGPQSTLFGRNTPAGVVSIVTRGPEFESGYDLAVTVGNYNSRILQGAVYGPLVEDRVAFRIDGSSNEQDGFLQNYDGRQLNDRDRYNVRGQLLFTPNDNVSLRLQADMSNINENCCAAPFAYYDPVDLGAFVALGATIPAVGAHNGTAAIDGIVHTDLDQQGFSAELNWDFDNFAFTYIGARRDYDEMQDIDADFSSLDLAGRRLINNEYSFTTHEFRLTSTGDNTIDWMVGAFVYDLEQDYTNNTPLGSDIRAFFDLATYAGSADVQALAGSLGLPAGSGIPTILETLINVNNLTGVGLIPPFTNPSGNLLPTVPTEGYLAAGSGLVEEDYDYNINSTSFFGQLDFHVNDRLTLTVGGRYSEEDKDVVGNVIIDDAISALDYAALGQDLRAIDPALCGAALANPAIGGNGCPYLVPLLLLGGGLTHYPDLTPINPAAPLPSYFADTALNPFIGLGAAVSLNPPLPAGGYPDLSRSDDNFSYNLIASYDVSDTMNVYASYSTGYKPGSFNISSDAASTGIFQVEEETTDSWEIGAKGTLFGGAMRYAVTYFDQTIEDFQSENFVGGGFALQNAGEIHVAGIEFDGAWAPTDRLTFTGGFTLLTDNVYESFYAGPCPDVPVATCYTGYPLDNTGTADTSRPLGTYNNLTGQDRGNSDFTGSLSGTYAHPLTDNVELRLRGEAFHTSEYALVTGLDARPVANQDSFTLFNASVALASMDDNWEVRLWGRNLTDEEYVKGGFPSVGLPGTSFNQYPGDPQIWGVTFRLRG